MKNTFKEAFKAAMPVILGYLPAGFGFGLLAAAQANLSLVFIAAMSLIVYAGAGQYLSINFFMNGLGFLQVALLTFLVNSKHLFYGLSLLNEYKVFGKERLYMIFALTDETYAILTGVKPPENVSNKHFMLFVAAINQTAWVCGSLLGGIFGNVFSFNSKGIEFAMIALFLVIFTEQLKSFKTRLPFIIGIGSALVAMFTIGKSNMLLAGAIFSIALLFLLRKKIEAYEH